MEKTNWTVTVYDFQNRLLDSWTIRDRNEKEAFNEAVSDVSRVQNFFDWSLMPEDFFSQADSRTSH
ncbi:MAG TPA: hypothetical protein VK308_05975 [Pyrinomonadaceae bacterium]|nr:hypothetical protein [Pyrinomonadaceae bacterium]